VLHPVLGLCQPEIEVSQRCALRQNSCHALCPDWSKLIDDKLWQALVGVVDDVDDAEEEAARKRVNEEEARKRPKEDWGRSEGENGGGGEEEEASD
jgi:hypothetical protein